MIDQINNLAGRRLVFTLQNLKQIVGDLVEANEDGFIVEASSQSFFGDYGKKRLFLLKHAVAYITEWSNPQWQPTKEKS